MLPGDRRPAPAGREHRRPSPQLGEGGRPRRQLGRAGRRATGRRSARSSRSARRRSGRAAGDSRAGVPWARARARAPLDENGRGYGKTATSAALNQVATSSSATHPVNVATSPCCAVRAAAKPALPPIRGCSPPATTTWISSPAWRAASRTTSMPLYGATKPKHNTVNRPSSPRRRRAIGALDWRHHLDAVGDHRRCRDDPPKGGLVDDRRRARPHDAGLHGGDPGTGKRGGDADPMEPRVAAVYDGYVDDLVHRRHERRLAACPAAAAEGARESQQRNGTAVKEQLELEMDDRRAGRFCRRHRRRQRSAAEIKRSVDVDRAVGVVGWFAVEVGSDDDDVLALVSQALGEVGCVGGDAAVAAVALTARWVWRDERDVRPRRHRDTGARR